MILKQAKLEVRNQCQISNTKWQPEMLETVTVKLKALTINTLQTFHPFCKVQGEKSVSIHCLG